MNDPIYISGKCHYASITEPNTKFDPVWSIQIEVDDDNRSVIEGAGLPIANKGDDRGDFVTIKRKVLRKDGTQRQAPIEDRLDWGDDRSRRTKSRPFRREDLVGHEADGTRPVVGPTTEVPPGHPDHRQGSQPHVVRCLR